MKKMHEAAARERKLATQNNKAARAVKELVPGQVKGHARDQAGKDVGVGGKLIDDAERVVKDGAPELVEASARGTTPAASRPAGRASPAGTTSPGTRARRCSW